MRRGQAERAARARGLDPSAIFRGPTVHLRKCEYTGFAMTIYSIDQAIAALDYIGQATGTEDCLPFAASLVEGGELIAIAEDNGDFGCGEVLAKALERLKDYNVLVCVSRRVRDCFVVDMVQDRKFNKVKEAADRVLDLVLAHVATKKQSHGAAANTNNAVSSNSNNSNNNNISRPGEVPAHPEDTREPGSLPYRSIEDIDENTYKNEADPALRTVILDILVAHYNHLLAAGTYFSPLQFSKQFKVPYKFFEAYWHSRQPQTTGVHISEKEEFLQSRPRLKAAAVALDQAAMIPEDNPFRERPPGERRRGNKTKA